jgi:hypothetical protein
MCEPRPEFAYVILFEIRDSTTTTTTTTKYYATHQTNACDFKVHKVEWHTKLIYLCCFGSECLFNIITVLVVLGIFLKHNFIYQYY